MRRSLTGGVLALVLLGCGGREMPRLSSLPEAQRLAVWAEYRSHRTQLRDLQDPTAHAAAVADYESFLARWGRCYAFSRADLVELSRQGESEGWGDSAVCTPPPGPILMRSSVLAPVALERPKARYTQAACEHRVQGISILSVEIDADGWPRDPQVLRSLPYGLDDAAVDAVRQSRWFPALLCGRPVAVRYNLTVEFARRNGC